MIVPAYNVSTSRIPGAGNGLFIDQPVARGSVIVTPADVRETQLLKRASLGVLPQDLQLSPVHWFEDSRDTDPSRSDECYINHSFEPNGLWHLGFVFALSDLAAGAEVTIDYRMLINEGETPGFRDARTGKEIVGFSWQENLRRSTALLQGITNVRRRTPALDS